jgi:hypothetical protein
MKAHGSYKLEVNKHTVTFKAYDSWNYEAAFEWGEEIKGIVNQLKNEPWACLVDLTEWELATPDTRTYISELYSWLNDQNLKYIAVIFGLSIQKEVLEHTYSILTNVEKKYCVDLEQANNWLHSVGF